MSADQTPSPFLDEEPDDIGPLARRPAPGDYGSWAWLLLSSPREAFRRLAPAGGYGAPCLYALGWFIVAAAVGFLVSFVRQTPAPLGFRVAGLIFAPFLSLGLGFVLSAVLFVIWNAMGSPRSYETAFRVWALLTPLVALETACRAVPFLVILPVAYGFYLLVVASREVHGLPPGRSWAVWSVVFFGLLMLSLLGTLFGLLRGRLPALSALTEAEGAARGMPGQAMLPSDLRRQVEEDLARGRAESERLRERARDGSETPQ